MEGAFTLREGHLKSTVVLTGALLEATLMVTGTCSRCEVSV